MDNQQVSNSEVWAAFPKNATYEISNHGRVRFSKSKEPKYTNVNAQGYVVFQYKEAGVRKTQKVHRAVASLFLAEPEIWLQEKCSREHWGEVVVKHKDNNKLNNHYSNLEWSDLKGNTQQAHKDGLIIPRVGELNGRSTLTEELVHKVCREFENGMTPKQAVEMFNISQQQATKIRAGFAWKHVWCQYNIQVNRRVETSTTRA